MLKRKGLRLLALRKGGGKKKKRDLGAEGRLSLFLLQMLVSLMKAERVKEKFRLGIRHEPRTCVPSENT